MEDEDLWLLLSGVTLGFTIQVLYDVFSQSFWTNILPHYYWGILIACIFLVVLNLWRRQIKKSSNPGIISLERDTSY